jgi:hypothetical protein
MSIVQQSTVLIPATLVGAAQNTVTNAEYANLAGTTSAIQTQINTANTNITNLTNTKANMVGTGDTDQIFTATSSGDLQASGITFESVLTNDSSKVCTADGVYTAVNNINASQITAGTLNNSRLSTNVTLQGNTFNGASQLLQLNGTGQIPAIDGSLLIDLTKSQVGLSNVPNTDATNLANDTLSATVTPSNTAIVQGDSGQTFANKTQGQINAINTSIGTINTTLATKANLVPTPTANDIVVTDNMGNPQDSGVQFTNNPLQNDTVTVMYSATVQSAITAKTQGLISTTLMSGQILVGNGSNLATAVTPSGAVTMTNTGSFSLQNASVTGQVLTGYVANAGTIVATDTILQAFDKLGGTTANLGTAANANTGTTSGTIPLIGAGNTLSDSLLSSNIARTSSVISNSLTSANIIVGNASNVATAVSMVGDVTISNTGSTTVVTANTSTAGKIQIATQTVVNTGTDNTTAVTPLTLTNFTGFSALNASNLTTGTVPNARLNSNVLSGIQEGTGSIASLSALFAQEVAVTWGSAFTTSVTYTFGLTLSCDQGASTVPSLYAYIKNGTTTTTGCTVVVTNLTTSSTLTNIGIVVMAKGV